MKTNLALDIGLLKQAIEISGLQNENDTVTLALQEFIHRRNAEKIIAAFGTVDFDISYDYKQERRFHV